MPADTTRDLVRTLLGRIFEGDPERIVELYAEHCDWQLDWPESDHGDPAVPWIRHRSGLADIAEHYRQIAEHHVPDQVATVIDRILVDGDDAIVIGVIGQTPKSTGIAYRARFALHVTFEHGLVVRQHIYEDSLAVARAFGVV